MDSGGKNYLIRRSFVAIVAFLSGTACLVAICADVRSAWVGDTFAVPVFGGNYLIINSSQAHLCVYLYMPADDEREFAKAVSGSDAITHQRPPYILNADILGPYYSGWNHVGIALFRGSSQYALSGFGLLLPFWMLVLGFALIPGWALVREVHHVRTSRHRRLGLCPRCGYDVRANPARCSECGFELATPTDLRDNPT
jgi:hypothetical protein